MKLLHLRAPSELVRLEISSSRRLEVGGVCPNKARPKSGVSPLRALHRIL
jgi:hypothetical protein